MLRFPDIVWGEGGLFCWRESNLCLAKLCKKFSIYLFIWSFRKIMFAIFMCLSSVIWGNWKSELFFSLSHPPQISPKAGYMVKQSGNTCALPISLHSVAPGLYICGAVFSISSTLPDLPLVPAWPSFPVLTSSALLLILRDGLPQKPP